MHCIVLPDTVLVAIPDDLLEYLKMSSDDVHQMLLTVFLMYEETRDDVWDVMSDWLHPVDRDPDLGDDAKLHDLINCYMVFKQNLDPYIQFIHRPPVDYIVAYINMSRRGRQVVFEMELEENPDGELNDHI